MMHGDQFRQFRMPIERSRQPFQLTRLEIATDASRYRSVENDDVNAADDLVVIVRRGKFGGPAENGLIEIAADVVVAQTE